jgi:hypothetical protein
MSRSAGEVNVYLASCPGFQGKQPSLRGTRQYLRWALVRSLDCAAGHNSRLASFCEAGLFRPWHG